MADKTATYQIEKHWPEPLLIMFGLEYIKYDALISGCHCMTDNVGTLREKAIQKLARNLNIEENEKIIMDIILKFRNEILFLLRPVVGRCMRMGWDMKWKWQMDFAKLLLPPWLRTVEMKLAILPQAVMVERQVEQTEAALVTKFKTQLWAAAAAAFARLETTFQAKDFRKVSSYFNIRMVDALDIWRDTWAQTRQRILQEVRGGDGGESGRHVDGEVVDLLLLHDLSFSLVTPESLSDKRQLKNLTYLYEAVLKRDIETVLRNDRPRLVEVWLHVLATYPFSLGFSSVLYIQRMWCELKQLARAQVLAFYLGRAPPPHPLLLSIVANFRHIVQEPLPKWSDFVSSKMIFKLKDIRKTHCVRVSEEIMLEHDKAKEQAEIDKSTINNICVVQTMNKNVTSSDQGSEIHLNEVLNNIDPTKANICLILDSNSDSEPLSEIKKKFQNPNVSETVRKSFDGYKSESQTQHCKVIKWMKENDENLLSKVENDPKLSKETTIPLVRCDEIIAWKKHYTDTININKINNKLCALKKIKNKPLKLLARECRNYSSVCVNKKINLSLNGLSKSFLRNDRNKRLFRLCRPLSVNLQQTNEQKMVGRKAKKVQLADIDEVRKINSTILTAEVAPVSISRNGPSEADLSGIFSEESMREITNLNTIDAIELDELFKKLPAPPLTPISLDKAMETAYTFSTYPIEHYNINVVQKNNQRNKTEQICQDDVNIKILNVIKNCLSSKTASNETEVTADVTTIPSSESDANLKLSADANKRQNEENNEQNQTKKKIKKTPKTRNSVCPGTVFSDASEEWVRQKSLHNKYFQFPHLAPKPCDKFIKNAPNIQLNPGSNIVLVPSTNATTMQTCIRTNANPCNIYNANRPTVSTDSPVIDLTESPDDALTNSNNTPIITGVYSLAQTDEQNKTKSTIITPILIPQTKNKYNTELATLTKMRVGGATQNRVTQMNSLVPVGLSRQPVFLQPGLTQYSTESGGRRFVIIPRSQLMDGSTSLVLNKVKIVNASLTHNPFEHIEKMVQTLDTPGIESAFLSSSIPWMPLSKWVKDKSDKQLVILQIDATKSMWKLNDEHTVVTLTDYNCETPIYCSLPTEGQIRIIFPQESNSARVYNPPTLQIYEDAANDTTPFAKWVKSVTGNSDETVTHDTEVTENDDRPVSRIKVKSFARLTDNFDAPYRVCLQDRVYMKVSEQPLKYAKVITALSSLEEFQNLVSGGAPVKLLPKDVTSFECLLPVDPSKVSLASVTGS